MATNHYKDSENHLTADELPEDVQDELSATFSPDTIYALLRDTYYRGPVGVGKGGKRGIHGGGKPGTGLRRPHGPLYDYPESWRQSVLRKAVVLDLVQVIPTDADELDDSNVRYVVTDRGLNLLLETDRCEECGRVNRPRLLNAKSKRKTTTLRTACPVHDSEGTDYERDEDSVQSARETVEDMDGVHAYTNDDDELRARDPDGLRDELRYGDLVTVDRDEKEDTTGVVVDPHTEDLNSLGPVNDYTADEGDYVVLYYNEEEDWFSGKGVYDRTALRCEEEAFVEEVPVFSEGQRVETTTPKGISKEVVRVEGDYVHAVTSSSNPYSEGDHSESVYHALELEAATRRLHLPEPEFEDGEEVRHLRVRDRDDDFQLGTRAEVAGVVEEDYDEEKGYYYVLNYAGTDDYYLGTYGQDLLPEEDARERDPDPTPFEEGDLVIDEREEDEEDEDATVWKVYDSPTVSVEKNTYTYRLVPEGHWTESNRPRGGRVTRKDLYARHGVLRAVEDEGDEE